MDNFDLKKYLSNNVLLKENKINMEDIKEYLIDNLDSYLSGDMEATAPNEFTLDKDDKGNPEYYDDADMFDKTIEALKSGDIEFGSEYGYRAVASLDGENILVKFEEE
jgi:hypothetical protein